MSEGARRRIPEPTARLRLPIWRYISREGVPVCSLPGGHAVLIYRARGLFEIPPLVFWRGRWAARSTSRRHPLGGRIGKLIVGETQHDGLAATGIPARVYTPKSHMTTYVGSDSRVCRRRSGNSGPGESHVQAGPILRHFTAPISAPGHPLLREMKCRDGSEYCISHPSLRRLIAFAGRRTRF